MQAESRRRNRPLMLDMQVIEALYLQGEEPHDYLHIKHERVLAGV
jgi:hypothetical protein